MSREIVWMLWRAVALQVRRARRDLKAMGREDPPLHAGVMHWANAKQQVGAFLQGRDVAVGLLDVQLQFWIARAQLSQPWGQVPLAEHHWRVDPHQSAGLALLFLQRLFGFLQLHQHQSRVFTQQSSGLGGRDGARVAV
ncbi:hypothetical protein D3C78_1218330 [compost metagenome]